MNNRNHRIGQPVIIISHRGHYLRNGGSSSCKTVSGKIVAIEPVMANVSRDNWLLVKDEAAGWIFAAPSREVWRTE